MVIWGKVRNLGLLRIDQGLRLVFGVTVRLLKSELVLEVRARVKSRGSCPRFRVGANVKGQIFQGSKCPTFEYS